MLDAVPSLDAAVATTLVPRRTPRRILLMLLLVVGMVIVVVMNSSTDTHRLQILIQMAKKESVQCIDNIHRAACGAQESS